jgi:hypothetical protein
MPNILHLNNLAVRQAFEQLAYLRVVEFDLVVQADGLFGVHCPSLTAQYRIYSKRFPVTAGLLRHSMSASEKSRFHGK